MAKWEGSWKDVGVTHDAEARASLRHVEACCLEYRTAVFACVCECDHTRAARRGVAMPVSQKCDAIALLERLENSPGQEITVHGSTMRIPADWRWLYPWMYGLMFSRECVCEWVLARAPKDTLVLDERGYPPKCCATPVQAACMARIPLPAAINFPVPMDDDAARARIVARFAARGVDLNAYHRPRFGGGHVAPALISACELRLDYTICALLDAGADRMQAWQERDYGSRQAPLLPYQYYIRGMPTYISRHRGERPIRCATLTRLLALADRTSLMDAMGSCVRAGAADAVRACALVYARQHAQGDTEHHAALPVRVPDLHTALDLIALTADEWQGLCSSLLSCRQGSPVADAAMFVALAEMGALRGFATVVPGDSDATSRGFVGGSARITNDAGDQWNEDTASTAWHAWGSSASPVESTRSPALNRDATAFARALMLRDPSEVADVIATTHAEVPQWPGWRAFFCHALLAFEYVGPAPRISMYDEEEEEIDFETLRALRDSQFTVFSNNFLVAVRTSAWVRRYPALVRRRLRRS